MRTDIHKFRKLLWMLNTIYQTKGISRKDLEERWEKYFGKKIAQRTFADYRKAIEEIFDINIECNASDGYKYYIEDSAELSKGTINKWLLTSFSINNMMTESKHLKERIHFERIPYGNEYLMTIVQAMKESRKLRIVRQSFNQDNPYSTIVAPYGLKVFKQRWYLLGVVRDKVLTFSLDRIHQLELMDEHFEMPEDFDLSVHLRNNYGIITDDLEDHPIVAIRIKAKNCEGYKQCDYLRTLPLHHTQKEVVREKEYSIFEVTLSPTYDFIQEILSKGDEVEILSPSWFREEIAGYVRSLSAMYKDTIEILDERDEMKNREAVQ